MDFIPLPDGVTSHEPIPDLGGPDYDNKGFLGYDERQGWNLKALRKGDLGNARGNWYDYALNRFNNSSHELRRAADGSDRFVLMQTWAGSFIQTWILYGIFQEALNRPVRRREASFKTVLDPQEKARLAECSTKRSFLKGLSGKGKAKQTRCITLQSLFREFLEKLTDRDRPWAIHFMHCVREAGFLLSDVDRSAEAQGFSIMPPSVLQALAVVIKAMFNYVILLVGGNVGKPYLLYDKQLTARLEGRNWCPSLVQRVGSILGPEGLYYASLFPACAPGHHNDCQPTVCVASNIDSDKYKVQHEEYTDCRCFELNCDHIQPTCGCLSISMPETEFRAAFEEEGFPLVRFQDDHIEIVRYTPGVRYVALSHVWSDGRGNPFSNALPTCQLRMIDRRVEMVYFFDTIRLFWIDTLCVPIQQPLKKTAILGMEKVYSSAACVLVLSAQLLSTMIPSTVDETVFRIFCSTWNTRLWTMQEAILARDIAFQFYYKSVRLGHLKEVTEHIYSNSTDKSHVMAERAMRWLVDSTNMSASDPGREFCSVDDFPKKLQYRSTSKPSDVAICGSVLLGSDLGPVVAAPSDRRIQAFWSCQKKVSANVLWSQGPRLKQEGFRWAPSNLLTTSWLPGPAAEIAATGLLVDGVEAIVMEKFTFLMGEVCDRWYRFAIPGSSQRYILIMHPRSEDDCFDCRSWWAGQWVLLLLQLPDHQEATSGALVLPMDEIRSEDCSDIPHPISVRYLRSVSILPEGGAVSTVSLSSTAGRTDVTERCNDLSLMQDSRLFTEITETRQIPSSQSWRIS